MKNILPIFTALVVAGSLSAQTTVLNENFSTWPPTGWTLVNNNGAISAGWIQDTIAGTTPRAWHEDEFGHTSDNTMVSPLMDLTAMTAVYLHFDGQTNWATYLANHPSSVGDGVSNMEVTTDGGLTWAVVWTDTTQVSMDTYAPVVDLSAYAGMANVQLGVHFYGTFAQEWWVDNVVVDDQPGAGGGLVYSITNLVAGQVAVFSVAGATPGGTVMIGYSLTGPGPTNTAFGPVDMSAPINTLATIVANGAGDASFAPTVPGGAAGMTLYTQGLDLGSGTLTNSLAPVVL